MVRRLTGLARVRRCESVLQGETRGRDVARRVEVRVVMLLVGVSRGESALSRDRLWVGCDTGVSVWNTEICVVVGEIVDAGDASF